MTPGYYAAATGMTASSQKYLQIARNLSSVSVPGHKREVGRFETFAEALGAQASTDGGGPTTVGFEEAGIDFSQGSFKPTGAPLDVAIDGEGFFVIEGGGRTLYTRNGSFRRTVNGELVTADGARVQGESGAISLAEGSVQIMHDGTLLVNSQPMDKLRVVSFETTKDMKRVGMATFATTAEPVAEDRPALRPGFLEMSNVVIPNEMVELIGTFRGFEGGQRAAQLQDDSLRSAISLVDQ